MSATTGRLLDLWLPPEDAGPPLGCLATTFTFEADFFEQQCLGRFLGLDTRPGEAATDIGYLIEREEKLAETPVCVIADRSLNPDGRSLRWDVLPVAAPTGVMHAKVSVLVWEQAVRFITTSANLSEHAFRRSIELAVAFDVQDGSELSRGIVDELVEAIERVVRSAPGAEAAAGPRPRALDILNRARDRISNFGLPERLRRGSPRMAVVMPRLGSDALDGLMSVWSGGPPRWATVMSPYFDVADGPSRAAGRLAAVLAKRKASVDFIVPVEYLGEREIAKVPRALINAFPKRIDVAIHDVKQPDEAEPRRLHGKLVVLESDGWIAALVGSSNFSAPGLGLDGGGNVEIGLAIGAPQGGTVAKALLELALIGEEVDLDSLEYEAVEDPEETQPSVPAGFVQVLGDPGPPARLEIEIAGGDLPRAWWIRTPDGQDILDAGRWQSDGGGSVVGVDAPGGELPFNVAIEWRTRAGETARASLPVNVTDPGRLPAPDELRSLPVQALLRALASVRPLHEGVVEAIERHERSRAGALDELDPLKRFSPSGQLLHRTREMSAALAGLRERVEKPAATLDAFRWRLEGPFGPLVIAEKLIEERRENRSVEGEESFMLAEIALTLAGVDLEKASRFVPDQLGAMRRALRETVRDLDSRCKALSDEPGLDAYVRDAFARAAR
jgi:hypothetical protein